MAATIALDPTTTPAPAREPGRLRRTLFGGRRKYLAIGLALLLIPGSAYAAWTVTGHGKGAGKVGSLNAPQVSEGTAVADLLPGGDGSASFHVVNGNPSTLRVTDLDPETGGSVTSSDPAACPSSNLTVNSLRSLSVPVSPGANDITVPNAYHLSVNAPSSCQGVSFSADTALGFTTP